MRPRTLAVTWVLLVVAFVVLLFVEFTKWRSLNTEVARAASERQRVAAEIQLDEQQIMLEMRKHSGLIQEMQWTSAGADPSAFLTRLADLAREKRMTITSIGPLQQQSSPQFTKSWHAIQVRAPYRDVRELAATVEKEKGILEDVHIEPAPAERVGSVTEGPRATPEVQARFKLTALELSSEAKLIVQRTLAATGGPKTPPGSSPALPVPTTSGQSTAVGRDPFVFLTPPAPPRPAAVTSGAPEAPRVTLDLKGIVSFPDGFLAIVNNQIVKVGDTVSGHRVERITENAVTLREPGATTPRTIELPEIAPAPPAAPRR